MIMNRQIKFRGKLVNSDEWMYGYLYQTDQSKEWRIITSTMNDEPTDWNIQPSTIGQFTGLLDRNGKEIYEGDILTVLDNKANEHYREVVYHHGCFRLHNPYAKFPDTPICNHLADGELNWEVSGNIHEQSES